MKETIEILSTLLFYESIPKKEKQAIFRAIRELNRGESGRYPTINKLIEIYNLPDDMDEILAN